MNKRKIIMIWSISSLVIFVIGTVLFFGVWERLSYFLMIVGSISGLAGGIVGREYRLARKIAAYFITIFFTSILFVVLLARIDTEEVDYFYFMTSFIVIYVTLVYGLPCSLIVDMATKGFQGQLRVVISFVLHLLFGFAFAFIIGQILLLIHFKDSISVVLICSFLACILYWGTDELLKSRKFNKKRTV